MSTRLITGSEAFDRHRLPPALGALQVVPVSRVRALLLAIGLGRRSRRR